MEIIKPEALYINIDFEKLCRCCLVRVRGVPQDVYEQFDVEMLRNHLNLFLAEDMRLPPSVCPNCANFMRDVREFRDTVVASHTKLMHAISNGHIDGKLLQHSTSIVEPNAGSSQNELVVKEEILDIEDNEIGECKDPLDNADVVLGDNPNNVLVKHEVETSWPTDNHDVDYVVPSPPDIDPFNDQQSQVTDQTGDSEVDPQEPPLKRPRGRPKRDITQKKKQKTIQEAESLNAEINSASNNETNGLQYLTAAYRTDLQNRVENKAAERSRLYRERHREEINQRRREIRQRQKNSQQTHTASNIQNTDEIEEITQATSKHQSSNSHTRRQQRYYERHKEEIKKRKRDRRLKQNITRSIPVTAAERNRIYRERHKQEINERRRYSRLRQQNVQRINTECKVDNDGIEQITKAS